jgi:hypothetical protein
MMYVTGLVQLLFYSNSQEDGISSGVSPSVDTTKAVRENVFWE